MSYEDVNAIIKRINELKGYRAALRQRERNLKARSQMLGTMPELAGGDIQKLEKSFQDFLPAHMVPGNLGPIGSVVWPFWSTMEFDFGTDPSISTGLRQTNSFQVSQEAGFLIMAITRDSSEVNLAGSLGPWQVTLRDNQSSRQLNDRGLPFQVIGEKSTPTILPTPYFLFPNARFEGEMSGWNTTAFVAIGEAKHQITFFGYRVRVEDAQTVLSAIYG